jgi:hypothetical protein
MTTIILSDVYFVESNVPGHLAGNLAICPRLIELEGEWKNMSRCEWQDTGRGRYVLLHLIEPPAQRNWKDSPPRSFKIISPDGEEVVFKRLTKELYDIFVKPTAVGHPEFDSDEAVRDYYQRTQFPPC